MISEASLNGIPCYVVAPIVKQEKFRWWRLRKFFGLPYFRVLECKEQPIPDGQVLFIDGSSLGIGMKGYCMSPATLKQLKEELKDERYKGQAS